MRWLDYLYLAVTPRSASFVQGWGDQEQIGMALDGSWSNIEAEPTSVCWTSSRTQGAVRIRDGKFDSSALDLPPESRIGRVRLVEPRYGASRGIVVALPSWGDDDWSTRERIYTPAVQYGLSLLMLENPFYGSRRRVGQIGTGLCTVSDFVLMGRAIMRETLSLLGWAREQGYPVMGIAGYSMGGQLAALTASLSPDPLRIALVAPSALPHTVFVDGPLKADIAWDCLGPDGPPRLRQIMGALSVLSLPPPRESSSAVLLGTRRDAFVQPGDVGAIARHWGTHTRWLDDGHISVITLRARAVAQAVVDAFA